jgi:ATP-dependent Clp protease adaptor protein ClpS
MAPKEKKKTIESNTTDSELNNSLILHNDEVHSFDYVINALIEICNHNQEQAAQCTLLTHYKGKCDVKKGEFKALKPLKRALTDRKLIATID